MLLRQPNNSITVLKQLYKSNPTMVEKVRNKTLTVFLHQLITFH